MISILISSYGRKEVIELCIEAMRKRTDYPEYDIVVFDSSGDGTETRQYLEQQRDAGNVQLLTTPNKVEHGEALNNLLEYCKSPLACLLDSDVEVLARDWLTSLTQKLSSLGVAMYFPLGIRFKTMPFAALYAPIYWPVCMLLNMGLYRKLGKIDWRIKRFLLDEYPHFDRFPKEQIEARKRDYVMGDTGWEFAEKVLFDNPINATMETLDWGWWRTKIKHYGGMTSEKPDNPRVVDRWKELRVRLEQIKKE